MPLLSILTPVLPTAAQWLDETAASVATLDLGPGWDVEWIVQEDSEVPSLRERVESLGGLYGCNPRQGGAAFARNMGLLRVGGEVTMLLDADDLLISDGVRRCLEQMPELGWVAGVHVKDDHTPQWSTPVPRSVGVRDLYDNPRECGFHPNNLMVHTAALWQIGGWPALQGMEDMMLLMRLNGLFPGVVTDFPTIIYRRHADQTISTPAFLDNLEIYRAFVQKVVTAQV